MQCTKARSSGAAVWFELKTSGTFRFPERRGGTPVSGGAPQASFNLLLLQMLLGGSHVPSSLPSRQLRVWCACVLTRAGVHAVCTCVRRLEVDNSRLPRLFSSYRPRQDLRLELTASLASRLALRIPCHNLQNARIIRGLSH